MTEHDLQVEIERLRAENERLKSGRGGATSLRVSDKGGVSLYGLGRFPVTLYKEQWLKLLEMAEDIKAFIKAHEAELKRSRSSRPEGHPSGAIDPRVR